MRKRLLFLFLISTFFVLAGCATTPKITLEYRTETTMELDGRIFVEDFEYFPESGNPAQIPNTALGGGIILSEPVAEFFTNAVRREFRQAGISLKKGGCWLTGEIQKILFDDLGFSVDYDLDVKYVLHDSNGVVLLDKNYFVALEKMSKFVVIEVVLSNINKMFSSNIKQLMEDDLFARSLEESCNV